MPKHFSLPNQNQKNFASPMNLPNKFNFNPEMGSTSDKNNNK